MEHGLEMDDFEGKLQKFANIVCLDWDIEPVRVVVPSSVDEMVSEYGFVPLARYIPIGTIVVNPEAIKKTFFGIEEMMHELIHHRDLTSSEIEAVIARQARSVQKVEERVDPPFRIIKDIIEARARGQSYYYAQRYQQDWEEVVGL